MCACFGLGCGGVRFSVLLLFSSPDGRVIVDWYNDHDPENSMNWSQSKKAWVVFVVGLYIFGVYMAAPIYSTTVDYFKEEFGVNAAGSDPWTGFVHVCVSLRSAGF